MLRRIWLGGIVVLVGDLRHPREARNTTFEPQNEFKLDPWVSSSGIFSINKAVLYLFLAASATCVSMIYIARRMQAAPEQGSGGGRAALQPDARQHHGQQRWTTRWPRKWFPFIGTLFLFIMFSNLIGYIPLPTNTEHEITVLGCTSRLLAVRRDRQPLDPAGAGTRRVLLLHL